MYCFRRGKYERNRWRKADAPQCKHCLSDSSLGANKKYTKKCKPNKMLSTLFFIGVENPCFRLWRNANTEYLQTRYSQPPKRPEGRAGFTTKHSYISTKKRKLYKIFTKTGKTCRKQAPRWVVESLCSAAMTEKTCIVLRVRHVPKAGFGQTIYSRWCGELFLFEINCMQLQGAFGTRENTLATVRVIFSMRFSFYIVDSLDTV